MGEGRRRRRPPVAARPPKTPLVLAVTGFPAPVAVVPCVAVTVAVPSTGAVAVLVAGPIGPLNTETPVAGPGTARPPLPALMAGPLPTRRPPRKARLLVVGVLVPPLVGPGRATVRPDILVPPAATRLGAYTFFLATADHAVPTVRLTAITVPQETAYSTL